MFSYSQDLEAINKMVISVDAKKSVGKRLLSDETDVEMSPEPNKKSMTTAFVARKLENILDDRRIQNQQNHGNTKKNFKVTYANER